MVLIFKSHGDDKDNDDDSISFPCCKHCNKNSPDGQSKRKSFVLLPALVSSSSSSSSNFSVDVEDALSLRIFGIIT